MATNHSPSIEPGEYRLPHWIALGLLTAAACLIYGTSLGYGFLSTWDDNYYITQNPLVRSFSGNNIFTAFTSFRVGNYAPVHILSYMADYSLWGYNPLGYRLVNLALHLLNGLLLYSLTIRLHRSRPWALVAALLFIVHPVQVESVVWISERKTLLAMAFFLGALHAFAAYRQRQGNRYLYLLSVVLFVLACLTKSVVVVLPLVILLYDLLMTERFSLGLITDKIPFVAIAGLTAHMAMLSQSSLETGGGMTGMHGGTLSAHIFTSLTIFPDYLVMLLWPLNLSSLYTINIMTTADIKVAGSLLLIILAVSGSYLLYRRSKPLFFWYATAIVGLLPVMQIVPLVTLRNDRYLYFPMIGIAVLAGYCATALMGNSGRARLAAITLTAMILLTLALGSHSRSKVWQNDVTLWQDATSKQPGCAKAWVNLAEAYHNAGNLNATVTAYSRALNLEGDNRISLNNLVATYAELEMYLQGMPYAQRLILLEPTSYVGHKNLGIALLEAGRKQDARHHLETALRLRPGDPAVLQQLGRLGFSATSP